MRPYTYVIERWHEDRKVWQPLRFNINDLDEVEEIIDLLQEAIPHGEFRPAQYTIKEYQYIKSFD